jgi:hypothetical protein
LTTSLSVCQDVTVTPAGAPGRVTAAAGADGAERPAASRALTR